MSFSRTLKVPGGILQVQSVILAEILRVEVLEDLEGILRIP